MKIVLVNITKYQYFLKKMEENRQRQITFTTPLLLKSMHFVEIKSKNYNLLNIANSTNTIFDLYSTFFSFKVTTFINVNCIYKHWSEYLDLWLND